jgi:hypothetical protein
LSGERIIQLAFVAFGIVLISPPVTVRSSANLARRIQDVQALRPRGSLARLIEEMYARTTVPSRVESM